MGIHQRLIECATPWAEGQQIKELRFGLGYSCVELSDGRMGVAWTPDQKTCSCTHLEAAGKITGQPAVEILNWLSNNNALERTAGLAVFNALNSRKERMFIEGEAVSLLRLQAIDHVVMIGYFAPVVPTIKASGCRFEVVELDPEKPDVISPDQGFKSLAECDIAIITATSIINGTCDNLLEALKRNRGAVILGPSTPMCPEAFAGTRITQLSGSYVVNPDQVKTIISEGGGTRLLKKHLRFATTMV
ncbi:MAG: DUF364 domain-containing protein [Candidatus Riflebacteria bacterium]|nr:DUF364 domain-containing protein [Candidatus Riflebacteria bacterium]